jgi:hypothetical protein
LKNDMLNNNVHFILNCMTVNSRAVQRNSDKSE